MPLHSSKSFKEYLGCELYDFQISKYHTISDSDKRNFIKEFLVFIEREIHSKGLVFGPSEDGSFYVSGVPETRRLGVNSNFYQTRINYTPPECIFGSVYNGVLSDMWIIGCMMYRLITNRDLFSATSATSTTSSTSFVNKCGLIKKLKEQLKEFNTDKVLIETLKDGSVGLMYSCILNDLLQKDPKQRLTTKQLLKKYFQIDEDEFSNQFENKFVGDELVENKFSITKQKLEEYIKLEELIEFEIGYLFEYIDDCEKDKIKKNIVVWVYSLGTLNLFEKLVKEEDLVLVKILMIIKSSVMCVLIQKGSIHPKQDEIFLKEFFKFKTSYNRENSVDGTYHTGMKIVNYLLKH